MQAQVSERESSQGIVLSEELLFQHKTLEERSAEYDGELNLDGEYSWGMPVGRETWCE